MVDDSLGRFIQPDSIIPDPYNPQDWDRYSYVRNNPVNRTDPTGHKPCGGEVVANGACAGSQYWGSNKEKQLTKGRYGGAAVRDLFDKLNSTPGWWNHNQPSSMPPEEFLGLMTLWERGGNTESTGPISEAAKNQVWMYASSVKGHPGFCTGEICENGIFNYLGAYAGEHLYLRVNGLLNNSMSAPTIGKETTDALMGKAAEVGNGIAAYDPSNVVYNGNVPYHWGNNEAFYTKVGSAQEGSASDQIIMKIQNSFVVWTINQGTTWGFNK